ncbi:MAG: TolC family outer membrane protein [Pseudomonadota bacterium]
MKKLINFRALLLVVSCFAVIGPASAASLLEIYQQALQSDPSIHEAEARRMAALEAKPQARGAYLPQVGFGSTYTDSTREGPDVVVDPQTQIPVVVTATNEADSLQWGFSLRQTLFRWDQIVNIKRANKTVARAEAVREAAQQDLIVRVAQRYFDVLAAEDRLTSINADRRAIARRLEQAKQRFEVGLIAITDVQESQAAYDQSIADEIAAKRSLATARNFLREITGEYVSELKAPGDDFPLNTPSQSEQDWVTLSMNQNLNLVASRLDEQLARDEIAFRRNGHYPTLDLVANSGETEVDTRYSAPGQPVFTNNSTTTSDSISLQFNIPIFSGGSTSSRVREAVYLHRASLEQLQRVTRETERQARDSYLGVLSERSRVNALRQAVSSSQTALEATQAGYEVGTRTIVEVLNSQFAVYAAITNYYQSRYDYIMNVLRLKQAAGNLQIQDLEEIDEWLRDRPSPEQRLAEEESASQPTR